MTVTALTNLDPSDVAALRLVLGLYNESYPPSLLGGGSPPGFTAFTPNSGPIAGGTSVVITGHGFTGATGVTFGPFTAASFTVDSDTQITAVTANSTGMGTPPQPCTVSVRLASGSWIDSADSVPPIEFTFT